MRRYLRAGTADNTQRAYAADLEHFLRWGGTVPASPERVAEYLAQHAGALAVSTLTRRLAGISKVHRGLGYNSPTSAEIVRATLRGIRRVHGRPQRQVAPITKERLVAMAGTCGDSLKGLRDRALLLIGFAGALRRSELVAISCNDIEEVPEGLIVTLRRSKTDPFGKGRKIGIAFGVGSLCPVEALTAWLVASQIDEGPVFRCVNQHGQIGTRPLSPAAVALIIKDRAEMAGLDPKRFSGHSLRAGLITSAASAGVPLWQIKRQSGHKSDAMVQRYIRDGRLFGDGPLAYLL